VPEAVPSEQEQLDQLRARLVRSHAFADCRGLFSKTVGGFVSETNPKQLRARLGSIRVMAEMLFQLREKGWKAAAYELETALASEYYTYAGEMLLDGNTVPATLVMYKPVETLNMLRWIFTNPFSQLNRFIDTSGNGDVSVTTVELYKAFPTLEGLSRERWREGGTEGQELWLAHKTEVLGQFNLLKRGIPMGLNWSYHEPMMATMERAGGNSGMSHPFAFLVRGLDQRDVLALYPRAVQDMVATWQFHLPKIYAQVDTTRILVGLHPEQEHPRWTRRYPAFASRGLAYGKGAFVIPLESPTEFSDEYMGDARNYLRSPRIILKRSGSNEWPWDEDSEKVQ
jgi:hypothetical protein